MLLTTLPMPAGVGVNSNPVRVGYRPVIIIAREGAQVLAPEYDWVNRAPSAAS